MPAPSFVGVGPMVSSTGTGVLTLTLTSSDLPAGVKKGDRLVVTLHIYAAFNAALATPTLDPNWTERVPRGNGGSGGGTSRISFLDARHDPSLFPAVFANLGRSGAYSEAYAVITAYRESHAYSASRGGSYPPNSTVVPSAWANSDQMTVAGTGFVIAAVGSLSGSITGFNTANGFTSRFSSYPIDIADHLISTAGSYSLPRWARTPAPGTGNNYPGAVIAAVYDVLDPTGKPGWTLGITVGGGQGWS